MGMDDHPLDNVPGILDGLHALGLEEIIARPFVRRLQDIRLLGTMQYVVPLKRRYSRYEHSLAVAQLSLNAAQSLDLGDVATRVAVLAGLLHDVGHTALSHGAEVFLRRWQRRFHQGHTRRIVARLTNELRLTGQSELAQLVQTANDLLSGLLYRQTPVRRMPSVSIMDEEIEILDALTRGPISIDTIEGVTRTARSIGLDYPDPIELVASLRRVDGELGVVPGAWPAVSALFELERRVYDGFIYSPMGMAAEAMLTRALELAFPEDMNLGAPQAAVDATYGPLNDFLTLTDSAVYLRIQDHPIAKDLLNRLEDRELFVSVRGLAPQLHSAVLEYLDGDYDIDPTDPRAVHLEDALASHLGIDRSHVILHSTIRKTFRFRGGVSMRLFPSYVLPVSEIRRTYRTGRTYGTSVDVFLPYAPEQLLASFSLPPVPGPSHSRTISPRISSRFSKEAHKKLGTVPTPAEVADFLAGWAIRSASDTVLDPASGDGAFLMSAWHRLVSIGCDAHQAENQIIGIEANSLLWQKSGEMWRERTLHRDFFAVEPGNSGLQSVDVVVGNPPFVRSHRFKGSDRAKAIEAGNAVLERTLGHDAKLPQGASSWAPFLLHACTFLRETGRLAMVLPMELLTAKYAEPLRDFLRARFASLSFVLFEKRIFEEQQDVLLLLADSSGPANINRLEVGGIEELAQSFGRMAPAPELSAGSLTKKWTALLTDQSILELLDSLIDRQLATPFGSVAKVSIGIVTGHAGFFTLTPTEARKLHLRKEWLIPVLTKAAHIPGARFSKDDLNGLKQNDARYLLLRVPPDAELARDAHLQSYIEEGRRSSIHLAYKCRTRWPWYSVPYSPIPHMFLTYMSGKQCRLCLNEARVNCTNTIHQVFLEKPEKAAAYAVAFYSSLTGLSIELEGRGYGGGLIKLEPSDVKLLLLPNLDVLPQAVMARMTDLFPRINSELRTGSDPGVWKDIDELVLVQGLGLPHNECDKLREECRRLQGRRMSRARTGENVHNRGN